MDLRCERCGHIQPQGRFCSECGAPLAPAAPKGDPFEGAIIAERFVVGTLLAVGGMGRVYRAVQRGLERNVAIKFIQPELSATDSIAERFLAEARVASQLNHPNVVSIYDFGRRPASEGGHLYLVMELLTGPSLASVLERTGPLPVARVVSILKQVLSALAEAHHQGVVHRDIKPENVLLEPSRRDTDRVKLIDFGIARTTTTTKKLTHAGQLVGTALYMAPEHIQFGDSSPSVDLYAVGVMLFQMLTGMLPFTDEDIAGVLEQHLHAARPDPRTVAPEARLSEPLAALCQRALAIEPKERFADAEAFSAALEAAAVASPARPPRRDSSIFPARGPLAPPPAPPAPTPAPAAAQPPPEEGARLSRPDPMELEDVHSALRPAKLPTDVVLTSPSRSSFTAIRESRPPAGGRLSPPPRRSAQSLAALARASAPEPPKAGPSQPPARLNSPRPVRRDARVEEDGSAGPVLKPTLRPARRRSSPQRELPLTGRTLELVWLEELLANPGDATGVVLWGRPGMGRTRLLQRAALLASQTGARVCSLAARPAPLGQVGLWGLRELVLRLTGILRPESLPAAARGSSEARAVDGLRALFGLLSSGPVLEGEELRRALFSTFRWAVSYALERARPAQLVLLVDDADRLDAGTLGVLTEHFHADPLPRFLVLFTSERSPEVAGIQGLRVRQVRPLSAADTRKLLSAEAEPLLAASPGGVEPLAAALAHELRESGGTLPEPCTLESLVSARLAALSLTARRAALALGVYGMLSPAQLLELAPLGTPMAEGFDALRRTGMTEERDGALVFRQGSYARLALERSTIATRAEFPSGAAASLAASSESVELRAWHALLGIPDAQTGNVVELAARLRLSRGEEEGAAVLLLDAIQVARMHALVGGGRDALVSWARAARLLVDALAPLERFDEAQAALQEALAGLPEKDPEKVPVWAQLAALAQRRGRYSEAEQHLAEARRLAEELGDETLLRLARRPTLRPRAHSHHRILFRTTQSRLRPNEKPPRG